MLGEGAARISKVSRRAAARSWKGRANVISDGSPRSRFGRIRFGSDACGQSRRRPWRVRGLLFRFVQQFHAGESGRRRGGRFSRQRRRIARISRRGYFRTRQGRGGNVSLARSIRRGGHEYPHDVGDAVERLRQLRAQAERSAPRRAVPVPGKHRAVAPTRRLAANGQTSPSRRLGHHGLLDRGERSRISGCGQAVGCRVHG